MERHVDVKNTHVQRNLALPKSSCRAPLSPKERRQLPLLERRALRGKGARTIAAHRFRFRPSSGHLTA